MEPRRPTSHLGTPGLSHFSLHLKYSISHQRETEILAKFPRKINRLQDGLDRI